MQKKTKLTETSNLIVGSVFNEQAPVHSLMSEETGSGDWVVQGIFVQGEVLNNNGRVYPIDVLDGAVEEYKTEKIEKKRALGELGHPDSPKINLDKTCILVTDLLKKGNDYVGKAKVLHEDCPNGKILRGLLKSGVEIGVSTRGLGSANKSKYNGEEVNLVDQFVLRAVDVVADPSAPDAYVNAIQEEKQYILDASSGEVMEFNEENYKLFESRIKNLPVKHTRSTEEVYGAIKNFLDGLRNNPK